ncbi:hypothetical protein GPJ56_005963 [Histomonas meleagridis]|uniref:uncharacterized protein n=1 Tax=Histomonas meleagridis TaxID=135588 RepID=UPI003559BE3E|nr:hypothetical protein GPJ56_005963 [Histomonas meleagridis]KAH0799369.1 hypothetical protein GO595_007770 [Histomonas meleagridis]
MNRPELKSICITAKSGIVIFSADFEGGSRNLRSFGGLITAMNDLSSRSVGAPVSYMVMSTIAITIVQSEETGIKVFIFHDATFYRSLAHCIATQILRAFLERFNPETLNLTDSSNFRRFNSGLGPAIRSASNIILLNLIDKLRGAIQFAVIFSDGDAIYTYPSNADSISVAANLQQLQFALQEVANLTQDVPYELVIEGGHIFSHIVLFGATTVVLQIRAQSHSPSVISQVKDTLAMLNLCFQTAEGLMA